MHKGWFSTLNWMNECRIEQSEFKSFFIAGVIEEIKMKDTKGTEFSHIFLDWMQSYEEKFQIEHMMIKYYTQRLSQQISLFCLSFFFWTFSQTTLFIRTIAIKICYNTNQMTII